MMKMKKKGFKAPEFSAPDIKDAIVDKEQEKVKVGAVKEMKKNMNSKKSKKIKKKNAEIQHEATLEHGAEEESSVTRQKLQKETAKHLTDSEYEELFASVLSLTSTRPMQNIDIDDVKEVRASEKDVESKEEDAESENQGGGQAIDMIEMPDDMSRDMIRCNNEVTPQVSDCEGPIAPPRLEHSKKKVFVKKKKMVPRQLIFPDPMEGGGNQERDPSPILGSNERTIAEKSKGSKKKKLKNRKLDKFGTWVQCTKKGCLKWRYLDYIMDPIQLPERWDCSMNKDEKYNSCLSSEQHYNQEEHEKHFFFKKYTEGSLVWAKMDGFPWWPGMVEIDPDEEEYFECRSLDHRTATHYHVVYFDEKVSRSWIQEARVRPFKGHKDSEQYKPFKARGKDYSKKVSKALEAAMKAYDMSLQERVCHYGFGNRFKGRIAPIAQGDDEVTTKRKTKKHSDDQGEVDFVLENAEEIIQSADSILKDFFKNKGSRKKKSAKSTKGRDNIDRSKAPALPVTLYKKPTFNQVVKAVKRPKISEKGSQLENIECREKEQNEKKNTQDEINVSEVSKSPEMSGKEDEENMTIEENKTTNVKPVQNNEKKDVTSSKKKKRKGKKDTDKKDALDKDVEASPIATTKEKKLEPSPTKGKKKTKIDNEKLNSRSYEIKSNNVKTESPINPVDETMKNPQTKKTAKRRLFMPNDVSGKKAKKFVAPSVSLNQEQKVSKQKHTDVSNCNLVTPSVAKDKKEMFQCDKNEKECLSKNLDTTTNIELQKGLHGDIINKDNEIDSCSNSQPFEYEEIEKESKDSIDLENEVSTNMMDINADSDFDFEE